MIARTLLAASLATLALGCTAPESANPTPRCSVDSDCAGRAHCHAGFCVPDEQGDGGTRDDRAGGEPRREECDERCGRDEHCVEGRCKEKDD